MVQKKGEDEMRKVFSQWSHTFGKKNQSLRPSTNIQQIRKPYLKYNTSGGKMALSSDWERCSLDPWSLSGWSCVSPATLASSRSDCWANWQLSPGVNDRWCSEWARLNINVGKIALRESTLRWMNQQFWAVLSKDFPQKSSRHEERNLINASGFYYCLTPSCLCLIPICKNG